MSRSRAFVLGLTGVATLALCLRLFNAAHAWFVGDDFFFLEWVQAQNWSWREAFWPSRERSITAYHPIGLDSYFYGNYALFGWNAFGYHLSALTLQSLTAWVVYRIARKEQLPVTCALLAAIVTWSAGPTLLGNQTIAEHSYSCAALFGALSLSWFLDWLRTRRLQAQLSSCVALVAGLMSNEVCATLPLLILGVALLRVAPGPRALPAAHAGWLAYITHSAAARRLRAALTRCWPQLIVVALYLDFRVSGVPRPTGAYYALRPGLVSFKHAFDNLSDVFGGPLRLAILLGLALAALLFTRRARDPRMWLPLGWLGLGLLPFAEPGLPASRFSLALLPAAGLCVGSLALCLAELVRGPRLQQAGLLALSLLCVPWEAALEHVRHPPHSEQRDAYLVALATLPAQLRPCVTVECGGAGQANTADCARFRERSFGGAMFRAVAPERVLHVEFADRNLDMRPYSAQPYHDCQRFELLPDQQLVARADAPRTTTESELPQLVPFGPAVPAAPAAQPAGERRRNSALRIPAGKRPARSVRALGSPQETRLGESSAARGREAGPARGRDDNRAPRAAVAGSLRAPEPR